jgi:hypothetical protein
MRIPGLKFFAFPSRKKQRTKSGYAAVVLITLTTTILIFFFVFKALKVANILSVQSGIETKSVHAFYLLSIVALPLIEELIFRLPLRPTVSNLRVAIATVLVYLLLFPEILILLRGGGEGLRGRMVLFVVLILTLFLSGPEVMLRFQKCLFKNRRVFFYSSALVFGLLHLNRIAFDLVDHYLQVIVYLLFMSIVGVILSFARLTVGLWYSVFLHQSVSATPYLFALFIQFLRH